MSTAEFDYNWESQEDEDDSFDFCPLDTIMTKHHKFAADIIGVVTRYRRVEKNGDRKITLTDGTNQSVPVLLRDASADVLLTDDFFATKPIIQCLAQLDKRGAVPSLVCLELHIQPTGTYVLPLASWWSEQQKLSPSKKYRDAWEANGTLFQYFQSTSNSTDTSEQLFKRLRTNPPESVPQPLHEGRKPKYSYGPYSFYTKLAIDAKFKALRNLDEGTQLNDTDTSFLTAFLVRNHPTWDEKKINWSGKFVVAVNTGFSEKCIHMTRCDGSLEPISLQTQYSHAYTVKNAFRRAVRDQTCKTFNTWLEQGRPPCPLCSHSEWTRRVHVDHHQPLFKTLLADFLLTEHKTLDGIDVRKEGCYIVLSDDALSQRFQDYHAEHATLRVLCEPCNLARRDKE